MDSIWLTNRSRLAFDPLCCANTVVGERSDNEKTMKKSSVLSTFIFGNGEAQAGKPVLPIKFEADVFNVGAFDVDPYGDSKAAYAMDRLKFKGYLMQSFS